VVAGNVARWCVRGIAVASVAVAAGGGAVAQGQAAAPAGLARASAADVMAAAGTPKPWWWKSGTWADVYPGSAITFPGGSQVGWRVEGQSEALGFGVDDNLTAGPGQSMDWPGTSVSVSDDGGRSWTTSYRNAGGIWGLDFLSATTGWVVGVTSLARTSDGGRTWQQAGEPAGDPLVTVDFTSATTGYGLSVPGRLFVTRDSGRTWTAVPLAGAGGALCFDDATTGYVSGQDGDLYRTGDGGRTWTTVHSFASLAGWTMLACSGHLVWQVLETPDQSPNPGSQPSVVFASADNGRTWTVAEQDQDGSGISLPAGPDQLGYPAAVAAASPGTAVIAGLAHSSWGVAMAASSPPGPATAVATVHPPHIPGLLVPPVDPANAYYYINGISFDGQTGWLYLDDIALGKIDDPAGRAFVYRTEDGGTSWSLIWQSTS